MKPQKISLFLPVKCMITKKTALMEYGFAHLPLIPLRLDDEDRSEMISQVLFGEVFEILEKRDKWSLIRLEYDRYSGWVDTKQFMIIDEVLYQNLRWTDGMIYANKALQRIQLDNNAIDFIPFGSCIPTEQNEGSPLKISYRNEDFSKISAAKGESIEAMAANFHNAPYLWGGKSCLGFDCSGFTQLIFKLHGIKLPRDASLQVTEGNTLSFIGEAEAGDLAFFDNEEGIITHVGIVASNNTIIHASGCVRSDKLDHQGIFNEELGRYTHKLRLIKRYF